MNASSLGEMEHLVMLAILRLGASTPERGGRAKRYFKLRASALRALRASRAAYVNMWRDYEAILDGV